MVLNLLAICCLGWCRRCDLIARPVDRLVRPCAASSVIPCGYAARRCTAVLPGAQAMAEDRTTHRRAASQKTRRLRVAASCFTRDALARGVTQVQAPGLGIDREHGPVCVADLFGLRCWPVWSWRPAPSAPARSPGGVAQQQIDDSWSTLFSRLHVGTRSAA